MKSKVVAKNGCGGSLTAKILITTLQVSLVPNSGEMWRRQHRFTRIVTINYKLKVLPVA